VLTHNALAVDRFSLCLRFLLHLLILLNATQEVKTTVGVLHVLYANIDPLRNDPTPEHKEQIMYDLVIMALSEKQQEKVHVCENNQIRRIMGV